MCLQGCVRSRQSTSNVEHRRLLWFAERYLILQISATPERNHILKPLGEL